MAHKFPPAPSDYCGYLESHFPGHAASSGPAETEHAPGPWSVTYGREMYGFGLGFPAPRMAAPYGFDPSTPLPPFGYPPPPIPEHPPATVNTYSGGPSACPPPWQPFGSGPQYDTEPGKRTQHEYGQYGHGRPRVQGHDSPWTTARDGDDSALLRQDRLWLTHFLHNRNKSPRMSESRAPDLLEALRQAAQLVARLEESCETLKHNVDNQGVWSDALRTQAELKDRVMVVLSDRESLRSGMVKASRFRERRARRLRARRVQQLEQAERDADISVKHTAIDKWRMEQIQRVQERRKEQELKLAADAVLCEVRKKQVDMKRMHDILRSLEKLHRLRKEAASRKGIITEQRDDDTFSGRLKQLRIVIKKRTAVYSVEEKALMVMLEGEQEEERRREQDKQKRKERERQLQRKHMLFGDELPADASLQPFTQYHTQAESSLSALLHIRTEWDVFLVASDHPRGSHIPQNWILPDPPSDLAWASALHSSDADRTPEK